MNISWVAHDALCNLKQMGIVHDYVKEFNSLLLDVMEVSELNKLFNFMRSLKSWAQLKLQRQGV